MADYYTQTSFELTLPKVAMDTLEELLGHRPDLNPRTPPEVQKFLKKHPEYDCEDEYLNLTCGIDLQDVKPDGEYGRMSVAWVHGQENFNVDGFLTLIQYVLTLHKLDDIVSFEWASTCSKPRLDSFGGGWAVITRHKILTETTGTARYRYLQKLSDKRELALKKQIEDHAS